ncbi:MAG: hypothetical protein CMC70_03690 [Flavobacteriaceae bacterium]|nr:hypothetical protein [Flavobacteriaceae bacterium]
MFELLTTVLFGAIAIFFAVRLFNALGRSEGHMEAPASSDLKEQLAGDAPGAHLRPAFEGPAAAGLEAIARVDTTFAPEQFLDGARKAYAMIVDGFASGNKDALSSLLGDRVYARYAKAIDEREARGETTRTEIERIKKAEIADAALEDETARVTVHFIAEIATETTDADGKVTAGDFGRLATVSENWVFERRTDTDNPNWVLTRVATA